MPAQQLNAEQQKIFDNVIRRNKKENESDERRYPVFFHFWENYNWYKGQTRAFVCPQTRSLLPKMFSAYPSHTYKRFYIAGRKLKTGVRI